MSSAYAGSSAGYPANITIPDDIDNENAASVGVALEQLADRTAFLDARVEPLASLAALTAIAAPTDGLTRHVLGFGWYVFKTSATSGISPFRLAADDATAGGWLSSTAHQTTLVRQVHVATNLTGISASASVATPTAGTTIIVAFIPPSAADININFGTAYTLRAFTGATLGWGYQVRINDALIDGATLSSAALHLFPYAGHAGLPARQPKLAIVRVAVTGFNPSMVGLLSTGSGYASLAAANLAAYEAEQTLVFTPDQNNVIDKTNYNYFAIVVDEAGTNAIASMSLNSIALTMSIPDGRRS